MPPGRAPTDLVAKLKIGLYVENGMKQSDVCRTLGVSQSTVSRTVDWLEHKGWAKWVLLRDRIGTEELERANSTVEGSLALASRLANLHKSNHLPHAVAVSVFASQTPGAAGDPARQLIDFANAAAPTVRQLLAAVVGNCGVTWGQSIGALISALERMPAGPNVPQGTQVVPLCGDTFGGKGTSLNSSSALSQRLARVLNRDEPPQLSLALLPAFVPAEFTSAEQRAIWKLIDKIEAYREIFGKKSAQSEPSGQSPHLAGSLNAIISGISRDGEPFGFGSGGFFHADDAHFNATQIKKCVLADLGGVLLARQGVDEKGALIVENLKRRWTGLRIEDLAACATRAASAAGRTSLPGVILFAMGRDKAEPAAAAVGRGLVNHLVIDIGLAEAMLAVLPRQ